ncbi:RNA pseudouridine synthase [Myxococcota bacterium]|nr:RNA pseudouridine synthase [Myxococcota bacterium]MBU1380529.1 RNA pseudouridine synthase [Myxococcota bacterium]MBU1497300.1 RNA pseudouridine synthase [Myxococcota bacterium]
MIIQITEVDHGKRIEDIIKTSFPGVTNQVLKNYFLEGLFIYDGKKAKWGDRVRRNTEVVFEKPPPADNLWHPSTDNAPDLVVVFEGKNFMVIDKPPGLPTLPRIPSDHPTLAGSVTKAQPALIKTLKLPREAGIVNRLDNNTSGLILVGLSEQIIELYRKYYANHHIEKEYYAIVSPPPRENTWLDGAVVSPSGSRDYVDYTPNNDDEGRRCVSKLEIISTSRNFSLVRVLTRYGRRHQVRVQLASIGSPIIGDLVYGGISVPDFKHHFLWARSIDIPDLDHHKDAKRRLIITSCYLDPSWHSTAKSLGFQAFLPV